MTNNELAAKLNEISCRLSGDYQTALREAADALEKSPEWEDAPTQEGWWIADHPSLRRELTYLNEKVWNHLSEHWRGVRWFGPIPEFPNDPKGDPQ
jgi:hypothetical protein